MKREYEIALRLNNRQERHSEYIEFKFQRRDEDGSLWSPYYREADGFSFDNLVINALWERDGTENKNRKPGEFYAWEIGFERTTTIENVEPRAKTLRRIKAGLDRLEKEWGACESFPNFIMRVCKVLGVKTVCEIKRSGSDSRGDYPVWELRDLPTLLEKYVREN